MRESVIEREFVKEVLAHGGAAYKLNSRTVNGLPDRLVLFSRAKAIFVELKAPGKKLRPLQRKRRYQLMKLGFPVLCISELSQIEPAIQAMTVWTPGKSFPRGIGTQIPEMVKNTFPLQLNSCSEAADQEVCFSFSQNIAYAGNLYDSDNLEASR